MYITKKFALKKTRMHSDDTSIDDPTGQKPWIDVKAYVPKGTIYYQISNGTIGRGAHYRNYSEKAFKELLDSPARAWTVNGCFASFREHCSVNKIHVESFASDGLKRDMVAWGKE